MVKIGAATALWASAVWLWPAEVSELNLDRLTPDQAGLIAASCVAFVIGSRLALHRMFDRRTRKLAAGIGRRLPMPIRLVLDSTGRGSGDPGRTRSGPQAPAAGGSGNGSASRPQTSRGARVGQTADM